MREHKGKLPILSGYVAFYFVMRLGTSDAVARKFGVRKSSIWYHLNALERHLNQPLFASGYEKGKRGRHLFPNDWAVELFELIKDQIEHLLEIDLKFPHELPAHL